MYFGVVWFIGYCALCSGSFMLLSNCKYTFNLIGAFIGKLLFSGSSASDWEEWGSLDDIVMGGTVLHCTTSIPSCDSLNVHPPGVSDSRLRWAAGENGTQAAAVFEGVVSTSNNGNCVYLFPHMFPTLVSTGGFVSVRTRNRLRDLSAYSGITLKVRGSGEKRILCC